jgi:hypothetical protein
VNVKKKERVITFKADGKLAEHLDNLPNRSEFIRQALEAALDKRCPLCNGSGTLTAEQQRHMADFLNMHPLEKCEECDAVHFTCQPAHH